MWTPPDGGVIDERLGWTRCFQLCGIMGTVGNFVAGWFFLLEMGVLITWCDGGCLVNPIKYLSPADYSSPLLWAQGDVFTQGEMTP